MKLWLGLLAAVLLAPAADWPEFRGPSGQGLAPGSDPPLRWSETNNVLWKSPAPGRGWSSPVVSAGVVWMTAATDGGRSLRVLAFDASDGAPLHDVEVFHLGTAPKIHRKNSHASPTPILEDNRVYVHFGAQGTAALDFDGQVLWHNREHRYQHGNGTGGSPVVWQDLLIFTCDGTDRQFVAALDKNTGSTVWTTSRGVSRMAFSTPLVIPANEQGSGGRTQVVTTGGDMAVSYDPATGREIWRIVYEGFSLVPRPVYGNGLVYLTSGYYGPSLFAVRADGRGDVTASHIAWKLNRGVPLTPSPLLLDGALYVVSDNGIAACLDAQTGQEFWRKRLGGAFSASPVAVAGRIYFTNEAGETIVVRAGREFKELARNTIDGATLASFAIWNDSIFLRSQTSLYRIGLRE